MLTTLPDQSRLSGFTLMETIAQGQFGQVHLALNAGQIYAVKQISAANVDKKQLESEILIHKVLRNNRIIRLHDSFMEGGFQYMVMEYAAGGELFDKILPDVGIDDDLAHFYFRQLMDGVAYLHSKCVAHRDLKPENLLLDDCGNLKICDFGLSTVFMHGGQRRRIHTVCGTKPYIAPEVLFGDYDGPSVDIWSCGIILFVLLVGNTCWDEPSEKSEEFCVYAMNQDITHVYPWNRLQPGVYQLIRGMCEIYEERRWQISDILKHPWVRKRNDLTASQPIERLLSQMSVDDADTFASQMDLMSQQPVQGVQTDVISFSQPISALLSTQGYQPHINLSQPGISRVQVITRFYTQHAMISLEIERTLTDFVIQFKKGDGWISFSTVDKRKCPLIGEILIKQAVDNFRIVNFKRTKGDPLEFRRLYNAIRDAVQDFVSSSIQ